MFLLHPRVKLSIVGSLGDLEVVCSASDRQGSNFESCVWRTVSSHSSHLPQEVLLAQFSLYVHKWGLEPYSFHFHFQIEQIRQYNVVLLLGWRGFVVPFLRRWRLCRRTQPFGYYTMVQQIEFIIHTNILTLLQFFSPKVIGFGSIHIKSNNGDNMISQLSQFLTCSGWRWLEVGDKWKKCTVIFKTFPWKYFFGNKVILQRCEMMLWCIMRPKRAINRYICAHRCERNSDLINYSASNARKGDVGVGLFFFQTVTCLVSGLLFRCP